MSQIDHKVLREYMTAEQDSSTLDPIGRTAYDEKIDAACELLEKALQNVKAKSDAPLSKAEPARLDADRTAKPKSGNRTPLASDDLVYADLWPNSDTRNSRIAYTFSYNARGQGNKATICMTIYCDEMEIGSLHICHGPAGIVKEFYDGLTSVSDSGFMTMQTLKKRFGFK